MVRQRTVYAVKKVNRRQKCQLKRQKSEAREETTIHTRILNIFCCVVPNNGSASSTVRDIRACPTRINNLFIFQIFLSLFFYFIALRHTFICGRFKWFRCESLPQNLGVSFFLVSFSSFGISVCAELFSIPFALPVRSLRPMITHYFVSFWFSIPLARQRATLEKNAKN